MSKQYLSLDLLRDFLELDLIRNQQAIPLVEDKEMKIAIESINAYIYYLLDITKDKKGFENVYKLMTAYREKETN